MINNLTHVEADQVLGHVVRQHEAVHDLTVDLVAVTATDAVVRMVLHDLFPHLLQKTVVVFKTERPGNRRQWLENVNDLVLNLGVGDLDIHTGRGDGAVYTHVLGILELTLDGGQLLAHLLDTLEHLFVTGHVEFTIRVRRAQGIHNLKDIFLQRHLVVAVW